MEAGLGAGGNDDRICQQLSPYKAQTALCHKKGAGKVLGLRGRRACEIYPPGLCQMLCEVPTACSLGLSHLHP